MAKKKPHQTQNYVIIYIVNNNTYLIFFNLKDYNYIRRRILAKQPRSVLILTQMNEIMSVTKRI